MDIENMLVKSLNFLKQFNGKIIFALNPYITRSSSFSGGDVSIFSQISEYLIENGLNVVFFRYTSYIDRVCSKFGFNRNLRLFSLLRKIEDKILPPLYCRELNKSVDPQNDLVICDSSVAFSIRCRKCINVFNISYDGFMKKTSLPFNKSVFLRIKAVFQWIGARKTYNVAVSEYLRKDMENHGIRTAAVINNSIDLQKFRPTGVPKNGNYLFAAAYTYWGKGFDVIEHLYDKGIEVECFTDYHGNPKIRTFPFVRREKISELYNRYRILIFPSRYESFGLVPLEALACGLPVVMNKVGIGDDLEKEIPEFVVRNNSLNEIVRNIHLIENDYNTFSLKARKFVEERYSFEQFKENWIELIVRIMKINN